MALKTSAGVQNTEGGTPSLRNHSRFYRASKTKEGRVAKARGSSAQQPRGASAATLGCSAHFLQFSSLLLCFRDCGDILWCQIFAWRHWRHTTTPPTTHTHTHRALARLEPGPLVPWCWSTSEKRDPGSQQTLCWMLCSACQWGSFDPQPDDDRSTLSSQSPPARAASARLLTNTQAKCCCKSTSIGGNQHSAGGSGLEARIQPPGNCHVGGD